MRLNNEYFLAGLTGLVIIAAAVFAGLIIFASADISDRDVEVDDVPSRSIEIDPITRNKNRDFKVKPGRTKNQA